MMSKAHLQSKTTKWTWNFNPPRLTSPVHDPAQLISVLLATLMQVSVGDRELRQWPYDSHMCSPMQFHIAPLSTWAVARTAYCDGPDIWIRWRKGRISAYGSFNDIVNNEIERGRS